MKLTDIKNSLNEISAIGGLKQVVKGNTDRVEGIKLSKEMAQAMIDWFNSSPYGRKYPKAAKGRLHLSLGIMSSMGLDRYAKHKGAKEELKYIKDLAKAMRDNVNEAKVIKKSIKDIEDGDVIVTGRNKHFKVDYIDPWKAGGRILVGKDVKTGKKGKMKVKFLTPKGNSRLADDTILMVLKESVNEGKKEYTIKLANGHHSAMPMDKARIFKVINNHLSKKGWESITVYRNGKQIDVIFEKDKHKSISNFAESVNEAKFMDKNKKFKVYDKLKKGDKIRIKFGNSIRKDNETVLVVTKGKTKVGKAQVERIILKNPANPSGVKYYLYNRDGNVSLAKGDMAAVIVDMIPESVVNEAKYDIGMARKGNGLTIYNKAEEENGDYKNVAHIDNKGKIKYYDKKVPSKIKKQIEMEAKKMMEIKIEGTMKLKDLLNESFESMKVYSNPFHTPFVKENEMDRDKESNEMTNEQKMAFLEAVKSYKTFGESVYRKEGLTKVYESIRNLVESAGKNMVKETEGSFDGITVGRHVKRMNESFKIFEKTLKEVHTLQQRLESSYDDIGEVLGKYYEINELEEGNEFGAARAKAIANGDSEFEVDGKTYPVKSVDKDDKENAKDFANESKSMKLTSMLNESFGMGELPSEKLMKMKVSAKDMMDSVKNKTTKKIVEGFSTEEKRIVLLAVRKLMKYKNIDINLAAQYVVGAAQELKMDIDKGRVKK